MPTEKRPSDDLDDAPDWVRGVGEYEVSSDTPDGVRTTTRAFVSSEAPDVWPIDEGRDGYTFVLPETGYGWVRVLGSNLSQPIELKIGRRGHRLSILGLKIDNSGDQLVLEVSAKTLREIRLGEILSELAKVYLMPSPEGIKGSDWDAELMAWMDSSIQLDGATRELPTGPAKQGKAPDDAQLRAFAQLYEQHRKVHPQKAMTLAARDAHMARSTGYRWLRLAADRGISTEGQGE